MSYKKLAKICLIISILSVVLAVWWERESFWGGFFVFLFFGVLLNALGEQAEEIQRLKDKDKK